MAGGGKRVKNVRSFFPPTSPRWVRFSLLKSISYSLTVKYIRHSEIIILQGILQSMCKMQDIYFNLKKNCHISAEAQNEFLSQSSRCYIKCKETAVLMKGSSIFLFIVQHATDIFSLHVSLSLSLYVYIYLCFLILTWRNLSLELCITSPQRVWSK